MSGVCGRCGPLKITHFIAMGWLLTIMCEEGYLCWRSPALWRSNRQARLFAAALVLLCLGALLRWHQRYGHVRESLFQAPSITQLISKWSYNNSAQLLRSFDGCDALNANPALVWCCCL